MIESSELSVFIFALFGGFAINIIILAELRNIPRHERPDIFSDWLYLVWFFSFPIIGGGLATAYQASGINLTPIIAINIGASAPSILKAAVAVVPQDTRNRRID